MLRPASWLTLKNVSRLMNDIPRLISTSTKRDKLTTSYICAPCETPLVGYTVGQLLQRSTDLYADREAVVFIHQNIRKTFQQLLEEVDQAAAGFISLGLKRSDRIGIWGPNSYEWIVTQLAAARAGLILVNINPAYKSPELRYALNKVEVKALVVADNFRNQSLPAILNELIPENERMQTNNVVSSPQIPSLQKVITLSKQPQQSGFLHWKELTEKVTSSLIGQVHNLQKKVKFDEPANIQFTSGTTGNPKGATLSHHNIVNNGFTMGIRLGYHEKVNILCIPLPLYHAFACSGVLAVLSHGGKFVSPSALYNGRETVKAIEQEKCNVLYGTPTMFVDILNLPDLKKYDLSSLSLSAMGGAPCPLELAKQAASDLNIKHCLLGYGMTEGSTTTSLSLRTDSLETCCSTAGFPADHVEVAVMDPNTNDLVPINTPGEICTRGFNTMLGYWNDSEKTKETITKDRWLKSGDIGMLDENGYVKIVGRIKDMVIRGGENVYPREIEEVLHAHPGIQEAHVIGVPDSRLGEELCAWVRCKTDTKITEAELREFCKQRLSYFKVPKYWLFKVSFPTTITGKVQKYIMRDMTVKELNLR